MFGKGMRQRIRRQLDEQWREHREVLVGKKTVKVQIAVAVSETGEWFEWGFGGGGRTYRQDDAFGEVLRDLDGARTCYVLTATLPLPAPTEVAAEVEEVKSCPDCDGYLRLDEGAWRCSEECGYAETAAVPGE
jgi:hypothetical protein